MSVPYDENDLAAREVEGAPGSRPAAGPAGPAAAGARPPTREELAAKVTETQGRIAELKRAQEELERERAGLEEARRRRAELQVGRTEMTDHLTRGIGLLEKAEFEARRDAEQMVRTLEAFRDALRQVEAIREDRWTTANWNTELTRALTTIENARMEWNGARLKWPVLEGGAAEAPAPSTAPADPRTVLAEIGFWRLCKAGLALTWPVALAVLIGLGVGAILWARR